MKNEEIVKQVRESAEQVGVVKAQLVGGDLGDSNKADVDTQDDRVFGRAGAIEPPYDPEMLCLLFEHSNALRQNIDAYATNIDGFGHTFEPVIDLESDDANERIEMALMMVRGNFDKEVSEQEIEEAKKKIAKAMKIEKAKLRVFFSACCDNMPFVRLRRHTRQDLEVIGNGYWEVLRNAAGEISQFVYLPSFTMRLLPLDKQATAAKTLRLKSEFEFEEIEVRKRFRKFIQRIDNRVVWFKELGDPRVISHLSGRTFESVEELLAAEEDARPATEVLHFNIHSPRSAYGVPRWIGNLLAVLGSRQAEEVNFLYFENKSVPPLAVLVSGGRINEDSVKRVEEFVETHIKGKRNFHKILILEAEPAQGVQQNESSSRMKIELRPLLGAQQSDALFQKYDERNLDKVGQAFRLPRMLRGDIRDFNRSTALAAKQFTEEQVFQPEREDFDWILNRLILIEMGMRFHRFRSQAPITRDPEIMSNSIKNLSNAGVLVPEEGRELAGDVFNREFKRIDEDWAKQPLQLTLAGVPPQGSDDRLDPQAKGALDAEARHIIRLRDQLRKAEERALIRESIEERTEGLEREVVYVPRDLWDKMIEERDDDDDGATAAE